MNKDTTSVEDTIKEQQEKVFKQHNLPADNFALLGAAQLEHIVAGCVHAGASAMLQRVREGVPHEIRYATANFDPFRDGVMQERNACREAILSHLDTLQKEIEGNKDL